MGINQVRLARVQTLPEPLAKDMIYFVQTGAGTCRIVVTDNAGIPTAYNAGLSHRLAYSGAATYILGNIVTDQGASWMLTVKSSVGHAPPTFPEEYNDYWALIAAPGAAGDAATIEPGTVTTLEPGELATVTNSGTSRDAVFEFGIPKGSKGDDGADGTDPGYLLTFETSTAAPPSSGAVRADDDDLSLATVLYVSKTSRGGSDIAARLAELAPGGRTTKCSLILMSPASGKQTSFVVDGVTDRAGYVEIAVSSHSGETAFSAGALSLQRELSGADGSGGGVTDYNDLTNKPTLGTAAATDAADYATAAQGAKADTIPSLAADTMLVDNPAGTARETKGFAAVSGLLAAPVYVSSRAVLKALDPSINPVSHLTEARRSGRFVFRAGDYSTHIAADTNEGVYIKATSVAATAGAWVREFDGPCFDRWFGVLADGVEDATGSLTSGTDDTTAMQRFATFIRFNGGGHYVLDGGIRKVWPAAVAHQTFLMDIRGVDGLTIEYRNGAKIHAMYPAPNTQGPTGTIWGIIWRIEANRGLTFINPSLEQEEKLSDPTSNLIGLVQFDLSWNSLGSPSAWQSRPNRNIRVLGAYQRGGIQIFVAHQALGSTLDTSAAREIYVDGYAESCYYGFVSQGGADRCTVRLSTEKCGRTLFVYNCKEIDADLLISNPFGTSGNVNITVYADSTMRQSIKDIAVRAKFRGTVQNPSSSHALVSHNFIWTGTGSLGNMTNCHVDLDVQLNSGSNVRAIGIHKYDNSGSNPAADATSRGWQMQNVTWSGFINSFTTTDAFDLFINNPLGTESFVGGGVAGCGFRNMWSAAAQNMNFDGAAIITAYGRFFFEDSYFSSTFTPTNAVGKVLSRNSPSIQGAGGAVTQATSRTTSVTLNEWSGQITTHTASLAAAGTAKFTVSNSVVTAKDVVLVSIASGSTTDATDVKVQRVAAGAFDIVVANRHASTAEIGAIVINYEVIRGASA